MLVQGEVLKTDPANLSHTLSHSLSYKDGSSLYEYHHDTASITHNLTQPCLRTFVTYHPTQQQKRCRDVSLAQHECTDNLDTDLSRDGPSCSLKTPRFTQAETSPMEVMSLSVNSIPQGQVGPKFSPSPSPTPTPTETVFLLDWDDTLFATTFVQQLVAHNPGLTDDSERQLHEMAKLDEMLQSIFERFLNLGEVIIVTNAGIGWVQATSKLYLPNFYQAFIVTGAIPVVYAKHVYGSSTLKQLLQQNQQPQQEQGQVNQIQQSENPFYWKINAFKTELTKICEKNSQAGFPHQSLQVVMLGDGIGDIIAANAMQSCLPSHVYLFVKFQERPTLRFVNRQLQNFQEGLLTILNCNKSKLFYANRVIG